MFHKIKILKINKRYQTPNIINISIKRMTRTFHQIITLTLLEQANFNLTSTIFSFLANIVLFIINTHLCYYMIQSRIKPIFLNEPLSKKAMSFKNNKENVPNY